MALAAPVLFYVVNNSIWLLNDGSSPSYDQAAHASFALKYLRLFEAPTRLSLTKLLGVTQYWPPFFHISSVPFTMVLGFSVGSVAATNFLFLIVSVASIYRIGRRLFDPWVGIGAVTLTLLYPILYALSRLVLVDFALIAMVALCLDLILASDAGLNRRRGWLLGIALGCAMLTKWTAVTFLIGPGILWLCVCFRRDRPAPASVLLSVGIVAAVALLVALPWYVQALGEFLSRASVALGSDPAREGDPTRIMESLRWYWGATHQALILKPLLVPTLAGFIASIFLLRSRMGLALLFCWIVPPVVFFLLIPNKDARFVAPALPAVAMIAAAGIRWLPWRSIRVATWTFIVVTGVYQFYAISFGWPVRIEQFYAAPPQRPNWRVNEILTAVAALEYERPIQVVAFLPNDPNFEPNILQLAVAMRDLPMRIESVGHEREPIEAWRRYDVIISKTGSIAVAHAVGFRSILRDDLRAWVEAANRDPRISLWRSWPLPDGSRAEAYIVHR
jgi:4-amino-4-deoxy-L-arabinose transferase-like glycosyltransferase